MTDKLDKKVLQIKPKRNTISKMRQRIEKLEEFMWAHGVMLLWYVEEYEASYEQYYIVAAPNFETVQAMIQKHGNIDCLGRANINYITPQIVKQWGRWLGECPECAKYK